MTTSDTEKRRISASLTAKKAEREVLIERQSEVQAAISSVNDEIKLLQTLYRGYAIGSLRVSDHAIVRFFERVMSFDVEAIANRILSRRIADAYNSNGESDGEYAGNGFRARIVDGVVVTILREREE